MQEVLEKFRKEDENLNSEEKRMQKEELGNNCDLNNGVMMVRR